MRAHHGNHGECDGTVTIDKEGQHVETRVPGPNCVEGGGFYKRNDEGYSYMGQDLASWGHRRSLDRARSLD